MFCQNVIIKNIGRSSTEIYFCMHHLTKEVQVMNRPYLRWQLRELLYNVVEKHNTAYLQTNIYNQIVPTIFTALLPVAIYISLTPDSVQHHTDEIKSKKSVFHRVPLRSRHFHKQLSDWCSFKVAIITVLQTPNILTCFTPKNQQ